MLRAMFATLSRAGWMQRTITRWGFTRRTVARFVAGETADQALEVVQRLNRAGIQATLDHLGESTTSVQDAREATREIINLLEKIAHDQLRANVSIKLSQLGLGFDARLCAENLQAILDAAQAHENYVRIDMEDSSLTTPTLDQFFTARENGHINIGIVLQAYLYRTEADLERVLAAQGRVRLCKGAYNEPVTVAFPGKTSVNENFDRLARRLLVETQRKGCPPLSADGRIPPIGAIATHDPARIAVARAMLREFGLPQQSVEFQMLYGIRQDLQGRLAAEGFPVRVYVPYGTHWYPYFMRRLGERPANLRFFLTNLIRSR